MLKGNYLGVECLLRVDLTRLERLASQLAVECSVPLNSYIYAPFKIFQISPKNWNKSNLVSNCATIFTCALSKARGGFVILWHATFVRDAVFEAALDIVVCVFLKVNFSLIF